MIIPHRLLSAEALRGVIEAFVTREGTDYGMQEVPLATKVRQVQHQLDAGTAVLVYDEASDSCTTPTHRPACGACLTVGVSLGYAARGVWVCGAVGA